MARRSLADPARIQTFVAVDELRYEQVRLVFVDKASSRGEVCCLPANRESSPTDRLLHRFEPQRKGVVQNNRPSKRRIHEFLPRIPVNHYGKRRCACSPTKGCSPFPPWCKEGPGEPRLRPLRNRSWCERLLDNAQHSLPASLGHGHQAAELETCQLHEPGRADRAEPEVGEEARREDRLVNEKALVTATRPRRSGRQTSRAPSRLGRGRRRSPRERATASPTGSTSQRDTHT